jgi:hypothetical protein
VRCISIHNIGFVSFDRDSLRDQRAEGAQLSLSIHVDCVKALEQIGEFVCMANILLIHLHAANLSLPSVPSLPNGAFASSSAFIVS